MPFQFVVHEEDRILEVVYPEELSPGDVVDYTTRVRTLIDAFKTPWASLVDQRDVKALTPELLRAVTQMNLYAANHGMERTARVVRDAVASLQASRIGGEVGLPVPIQTFQSREDALEWLRSERDAE